ncbi:MAG: hypothetical protein C0518_08860 [Opitutus sp.]|nr:hypothetical protein [Opitutus sp.]
MSKSQPSPPTYVSRISFVGRSTGAVKALAGFRKQHHTVPDAINAATVGFLAKLCAGELATEAERTFRDVRTAFGYKRAELSLEVTSSEAVLAARDFAFSLHYTLADYNPAEFMLTRTLQDFRTPETLARPEFDTLFAGQFSSLVFELVRGVRVEAVIDAVEALERGSPLRVTYPSDCAHCELTVEGVNAQVWCNGATLEMQFPRRGSPRELAQQFEAVRSAFALTKDRVLAGLL